MSTPTDAGAVQALWEESSRRLHAWFERRTGSAHDADDLVGETFVRVQSRLATLRDGERLGAWVGALARNVLADHGRARGRPDTVARPVEHGELPPEHAVPEAEDEVGAGLTAAVAGWIEAFLTRLEPGDAAILRAVELEGRSQVDVAREQGLSPSGARSRVQRARARLRRELEACCRFAFDARGNLTQAIRRPGSACDCEDSYASGCDSIPGRVQERYLDPGGVSSLGCNRCSPSGSSRPRRSPRSWAATCPICGCGGADPRG